MGAKSAGLNPRWTGAFSENICAEVTTDNLPTARAISIECGVTVPRLTAEPPTVRKIRNVTGGEVDKRLATSYRPSLGNDAAVFNRLATLVN